MSKQPFGFPDMTQWVKDHPGNIEFCCEFCGIYTAGEPRCNKCQGEKSESPKTGLGTFLPSESVKSMERTIFQIMTDNGMSEDDADKTINNMSVKDMERYLEDARSN